MEDKLKLPSRPEILPHRDEKPVIIGIYGLPGCGKSFLLNQLKAQLDNSSFVFFEGSQVIADACPGGLEAFRKLGEHEKVYWRQSAMTSIQRECSQTGKTGIVAGHFMFWREGEEIGHEVWTPVDSRAYTHVVYLEVPAERIAENIANDRERARELSSIVHLRKWQDAEKNQLCRLCRDRCILFVLSTRHLACVDSVSTLLQDFQSHTEKMNTHLVENDIDGIMARVSKRPPQRVLVIDADKTLAAEDSGFLFWKLVLEDPIPVHKSSPLKSLFDSPLGYSYLAFRQATLLYEEAADDEKFQRICDKVALEISMYMEFVSLLHLLKQTDVCAVVLTCGTRCVWQKVLEREGLNDTVNVIGGGRLADRYVVTPAVKAAVVTRLHDEHAACVWAFGDSPLDLDMLREANHAIIVTGSEESRSKSMEVKLQEAIGKEDFRPRQAVLSFSASPRLDTSRLPLVQLTSSSFINEILPKASDQAHIELIHATDNAGTKLLMTPMRDRNLSGPALRKAHKAAGSHIATQFLADLIGLEKYSIEHVQGHTIDGYRLLHEKETLIVALMRGGEPMALGINDTFPLAMFLHARTPEDITPDYLSGRFTILLVDSVVNSGNTVLQFVHHIRSIHATVGIVVVAGVVQEQAITKSGGFFQSLSRIHKLSLVTLRVS
ncbi:uncharacterized protein N7459_006598 [Penicillium hispanicum]|uniref:uncharacterized protein n=1 Tax=Penicillium hispanicum TaxID=1080232 RepID=UPI0025425C7F|nr:uncharacterized protein N7459_006598 [Penicillium hispanicum]KAJ5577634.1 hypothetical protein N7459_006598 [Penicillium hispanicum]